MLTEKEFNEIKERCENATPGPWVVDKNDFGVVLEYKPECKRTHGYGCGNTFVCDLNDGEYHEYVNIEEQKANAEFIAKARQDIPALIECILDLEAQRDWLAAQAAEYTNKVLKYERSVFSPPKKSTMGQWLYFADEAMKGELKWGIECPGFGHRIKDKTTGKRTDV